MALLRPAADAAPADWLLAAPVDWADLVRFGSPRLAVHLRVPFSAVPETARPAADAVDAVDAVDDQDPALRVAVSVLARHTATPQRCYAAVWEGWTGTAPAPSAPRVGIAHRTMLLFEGPVEALRDAPTTAWWGAPQPGPAPHLSWPRDRAWCLACDVDEEVEFTVGCSRAAAADVLATLPQARTVAYGTTSSP